MSDVLFEVPSSMAPIPIDDPSAALHFCRTLMRSGRAKMLYVPGPL
jgi:hypothetical protein